jgi:hypothetical protein
MSAVLQKQAVVFVIRKMPAQQPVDEIEDFGQLMVIQTLYDGGHDRIIGKFLKIADEGVLICLTVEAESDQTRVTFDKLMGMLGHRVPASKK